MEELTPVSPRYEEPDEDDVVWVLVVRGKRTSLILSSVEFAGSLVSLALLANVSIPHGSLFMFVMELITFLSCGIFLIPPFLQKFMKRFQSVGEKSRILVLMIALWSFLVGFLTFLSAVVASRVFEECRGLDEPGVCSKMQAAISITFVVSIATLGSFLLVFLGSVIPKDVTVQTYVRGLGRAATLAAARGASGRVIDHRFESIPLDVVVHTNRSFAADDRDQPETPEWTSARRDYNRNESPLPLNFNREENVVDFDDDAMSITDERKAVDAMDII